VINDSCEKRLFFGFQVEAPWPEDFPSARLLDPSHRHLTVAFLGKTSYQKVQDFLERMPKPSFLLGQVGVFDSCLFLPPKTPRVVAYHMKALGYQNLLLNYQKELSHFLEEEGYHMDKRDFLPHVTLGRSPFFHEKWEEYFFPLPMYYSSLHLYESLGNSHYQSLWNFPLQPPFIEIEHEADIAFHIYGETPEDIHLHAQMALSFECPALLKYLDSQKLKTSIEEIVIQLNEMVIEADREEGTPFKAVSFHGDICKKQERFYEWEMIVDV